MRQKEERDLENALAWDGKPGNMDAALEAMRIDKEESKQFFKEAGKDIGALDLLDHRQKSISTNLTRHWFIYNHPGRKEIWLLTSSQHIDGEKYSFTDEEDKPLFSYY
jgi:hypothetical protein